MKTKGILLAISSLPSKYGIGDLGLNAYKLIDILSKNNNQIWQVLPLTPLGYGNSPYQSSSSFAGDEIYICLDKLAQYELLDSTSLQCFNANSSKVDYDSVRNYKDKYLLKAFESFLNTKSNFESEYSSFLEKNEWVYNYAIFQAFKQTNNNQVWNDWPDEFKFWCKDKNIDLKPYQRQIDYQLFLQFMFYKQWFELKVYANTHNVEIMGDLPIYLGLDSADIWEHHQYFQLDKDLKPTFVAGVPPDFFSETGQLWGNLLYDWDKLEQSNFKFWIDRLKGNFELFDLVRIDHFRAFDTYWRIPADESTAINGKWLEAPGYKFFDSVYDRLPKANIIAEDLGDLRQEVFELRDHYNLKGMKVFQFHFDFKTGDFIKDNNIIAYSGTHDNNTLKGWYNNLSKWQKKLLKRYFKANEKNILNKILKFIYSSEADFVITPAQDLLQLDASARLNTPGEVGSPNWEWKLVDYDCLERINF